MGTNLEGFNKTINKNFFGTNLFPGTDFNLLIEILLKICPEIKAIVVEGSYGRGEGGILEINGLLMPVNDYDILLITKDRELSIEKLILIKEKFLENSLIRRLDLSCATIPQLRSLKPTLLNFDRKYGSKVIYGDEDILLNLPEWKPEDIPLREAEKLMFTRLIGFILCYNYVFQEKEIDAEKEFFLHQQLSKSVIAATDARIMMLRKYHVSYRERARLASEMDIFNSDEKKFIEEEFHFKLHPSMMIKMDKIQYYNTALSFFLKQFKILARHIYQRNINLLNEYDRLYLKDLRRRLIILFERMRGKDSFKHSLYLCLAQLFFVLSLDDKGNVDEKTLNIAWIYLTKMGVQAEPAIGSVIENIISRRM